MAAPQRQKIIIDTDIGGDIDDAFAVALALQSPEFRILGITTASGDTTMRARVVTRLLNETGRGDIPVAAGVPTGVETAHGPVDEESIRGQFRYGLRVPAEELQQKRHRFRFAQIPPSARLLDAEPAGDAGLVRRAEPVLGAAGEEMQMAAHQPEEAVRFDQRWVREGDRSA